MADPQDALFKALNSNTQYQAAKSGTGGLLDMLLTGYQMAFPHAPAANLAMGMRQAYNSGRYNKAVQAEAAMQRQRQATTDANNASIYNRRTGMNVSGPFDVTLANDAAGDIRKDNAIPSMNDVLQGKSLVMQQGADYDPAFVRDYVKQQGEANNYIQKSGGLGDIGAGQNASLIRQSLNKMTGGGIGVPSLDPGQPRMFTTGASVTQPGRGIDTNVSPWMYATDVPTNVAGLMKAGLDDSQAKGTLNETSTHNRNTEKIGQQNADAHMISAKKPSAGRAPTLLESMSPAQRAQYLARMASGVADKPVKYPKMTQKDMEAMQNLRKQYNNEAGGFFKNPAKAEAARQQYNAYANQFGLDGIGGTAPFGGQSKAKLKQAGTIKGTKGTYVIPD